MEFTSEEIRLGGGLVILNVPFPVISLLLSFTCFKDNTCPNSWPSVHLDALLTITAPGLPEGKAAQPLYPGMVLRTK